MADPEAKILERVARKQNRTGMVGIQTHSKQKTNYSSIINEINQRSNEGQLNTLKNQLFNIPWN